MLLFAGWVDRKRSKETWFFLLCKSDLCIMLRNRNASTTDKWSGWFHNPPWPLPIPQTEWCRTGGRVHAGLMKACVSGSLSGTRPVSAQKKEYSWSKTQIKANAVRDHQRALWMCGYWWKEKCQASGKWACFLTLRIKNRMLKAMWDFTFTFPQEQLGILKDSDRFYPHLRRTTQRSVGGSKQFSFHVPLGLWIYSRLLFGFIIWTSLTLWKFVERCCSFSATPSNPVTVIQSEWEMLSVP